MSRWQEFWRGFRRDEQAVLLVCAVALAFCGGLSFSRWSTAQPLPPLFKDAPRVAGKGSTLTASSATVMVHVTGAVRKPGVLTLPEKARIVDAIRAAGGATQDSDANSLNLAAHLEDGQQVVVPTRQTAISMAVAQPQSNTTLSTVAALKNNPRQSKKEFTGVINMNRASASELEALPGVGPAIAGRIIAYRTQNGPFHSLSDLDAVKGIGVKKLGKLKDHVAF